MKRTIFFIIMTIVIALLWACKKDKVKSEIYTDPFDISEGQTNWTKIPFDTTIAEWGNVRDYGIYDIWFTDDTIGFIAGYRYFGGPANQNLICKTTNGGKNWVTNYVPGCGAGSWFSSVCFLSPLHGFASRSCHTYHDISETNDGGNTWRISFVFNDNNVIFWDPNLDFVVDESKVLINGYKTTDSGQSWQKVKEPVNTTTYYFRDINYGLCATKNGLIAETYDFGETWDTLFYSDSYSFESVTQTDSMTVFAAGNKIIKSTDKGKNWKEVSSSSNITDIKFINNNIGFASTCTSKYPDISGTILKTTDGGETWNINYHSEFLGYNTLLIINDQTVLCTASQYSENEFIKNADIKKGYIIKTTTQGE